MKTGHTVQFTSSSGTTHTGKVVGWRKPLLNVLPLRAELRIPGMPGICIIYADRLRPSPPEPNGS